MTADTFSANLIVIIFSFMGLILVTLYTSATSERATQGPHEGGGMHAHGPMHAPAQGCYGALRALPPHQGLSPACRRPPPAPAAANLTAMQLQNRITSVADLPGRRVGTWTDCECPMPRAQGWGLRGLGALGGSQGLRAARVPGSAGGAAQGPSRPAATTPPLPAAHLETPHSSYSATLMPSGERRAGRPAPSGPLLAGQLLGHSVGVLRRARRRRRGELRTPGRLWCRLPARSANRPPGPLRLPACAVTLGPLSRMWRQ